MRFFRAQSSLKGYSLRSTKETLARMPGGQSAGALVPYLLGALLVCVAPLDLAVSAGRVFRKAGRSGGRTPCYFSNKLLKSCVWYKQHEGSLSEEQLKEHMAAAPGWHGETGEMQSLCDGIYNDMCVDGGGCEVASRCEYAGDCKKFYEAPPVPSVMPNITAADCPDAPQATEGGPSSGVEDLWGGEVPDESELLKAALLERTNLKKRR